MKRVAILLLLALGVVLAALPRPSSAASDTAGTSPTPTTVATTQINGLCVTGPFNAVAPCVTPTGTVPRAPIVPVKSLAVSAPITAPAGTTRYNLHLTSQLVCFTPTEPIYVYTFGQSDAAALSVVVPTPSTSGTPQPATISSPAPGADANTAQHIVLTPGPGGTSDLSLEVFNAAVGQAGLGVAAAWPEEGIAHSQVLIKPAAPTASPGATATPGPTATVTGTPGPTSTPAPGPFSQRACVSPSTVTQGSPATLYVQTAPGAKCSASVNAASTTLGGPQIAGADGFAVFPFTPGVAGTSTATVICTFLGVNETSTATFTAARAPVTSSSTGATGSTGGTAPAGCTAPGAGFQANVVVGDTQPKQTASEVVEGCFFDSGAIIPGVPVTFQFRYINNTTQSCSTFTGFDGTASCALSLSKAPAGYPVAVTAFFMYEGATYTATTSFTPVA